MGRKRKLATVKGKKADVSSGSPSSERLEVRLEFLEVRLLFLRQFGRNTSINQKSYCAVNTNINQLECLKIRHSLEKIDYF